MHLKPSQHSEHKLPQCSGHESVLHPAGGWGSSPAPMQQSWFGAAEYPQTRPWLQRVLHLWPSSLQDLVD